MVKGAIAKKAIKVFFIRNLVTREIFAIMISKKSMAIFHGQPPLLLLHEIMIKKPKGMAALFSRTF